MTTPGVITGLGIVAPNGVGTNAYWEALVAGKSAVGEIDAFDAGRYPVRLAGEARDFEGSDHLPPRLVKQTDRATQMALVAADWALAEAGVDPAELVDYDTGVVTSSAVGGFGFGQAELQKLWSKGSEYVSVYQSYAWFYAVNTGQISIRHGMRGACGVLVGEQAGGLDAIAHARRNIRNGAAKLVLTGGLETTLCPWGWVAQIPNGRISRCAEPHRAFVPFDSGASGYVPGEGGAMLVAERADFRGRHPEQCYGVIAGHAATFDASPDRGTLPRAIRAALADAGVEPAQVDVVFADASGVPELDRAEARAITEVFGARGVPVTAPKTMTGRLYAGGGPLDVATALLSIRNGLIPPTVNIATVASGCASLDLVVHEPRPRRIDVAVVIARGYGGFNSVLVVNRYRH